MALPAALASSRLRQHAARRLGGLASYATAARGTSGALSQLLCKTYDLPPFKPGQEEQMHLSNAELIINKLKDHGHCALIAGAGTARRWRSVPEASAASGCRARAGALALHSPCRAAAEQRPAPAGCSQRPCPQQVAHPQVAFLTQAAGCATSSSGAPRQT
jgi:hypothetical protein